MPDFLNRHTLHLTPLSPIHLGTGEDYEPTNYIIDADEKALYAFDPARAELDANQRGKLLNIAKSGDIQQIQKYFADNPEPFRTAAHSISSVSDAIASEYQKSLGHVVQREQRGSHTDAVYNRLNIERTATNPHTCAPLIPGSALKGCLRTALLEERSVNHHGENPTSKTANRFEQEHLGNFATDLLRLVKPADLAATGNIATHICYATNHKKKNIIGKDGHPVEGKGVTGRRETIQHGQYRAFSGSLTLQNLLLDHRPHIKNPGKTLPGETRPDFARLIRAANRYHLTRFTKESALLAERGLIHPQWQRSTEQLLRQLIPQFDAGNILLVRLGKNGGAEAKTLEKYAQIKIMGAKGAKPTYEKHTKTVWLAAENDKTKRDLLPFGWALIEIDPTDDNPALREWCDKNSAHLKDAAVLRDKLRAAQNAKAEQAAKNAAEAAAKAAAAAAKQAEEEAEAARVAALPTHERLAHDILARLEEHSKTYSDRNQEKNLALHRDILDILERAHGELDSTRQKQLAELLPYKKLESACKGFYSGKKEKDIKAALQKLRGG